MITLKSLMWVALIFALQISGCTVGFVISFHTISNRKYVYETKILDLPSLLSV